MAATGTTPSELLIDINNVIRSKDQPNTITPDTHSGLLDNMVKVLSGDTYVNSAEYTQSASTITFTNTSGGTFDVTILPATDDVIYVSNSTGNDSTGAIGSKQTAFKTISAAVNYANTSGYTGDTALIYVLSDSYADDNIAYNGNFYFEEGAVVRSTPRNNADPKRVLFLFGTFDGVTNNTTKCSILGRGTFITDVCLDGNCWNLNPFFIQGSGVDLYIEAKSIEGYTSQPLTVGGSNNKITGKVSYLYSEFHSGGNKTLYIEGTGHEVILNIDELVFKSISGSTFTNSQGITLPNLVDSEVILNIDKITLDVGSNTGSHGIMIWEYVDSDASNSEIIINCRLLESTSNGIYEIDVSSGKYILNIDKIDSREDGILMLNRVNEPEQIGDRAFTVTFNGEIESKEGYAINISRQNQVGARHYFNGNFTTFDDSKSVIRINENDGEMYFDGIVRALGTGTTANGFQTTASLVNNPIIRNVIVKTEGAETFASTVANTFDVLGSLSLSHEANSAVTFTGSYELSGKTHVNELNINTLGSGTSVTNLGLDVFGNVVTGNTAQSFTGGTVTGDTIFTGGLSACTGGITTNIINACEGNGQLNLRNGGNDIVSLTNDNGTFSDTGIYISQDYGALYSDAYTSVWETSPNFITGYLSNVGIQISNQTGDTLFSKAGIIIGATATGSLTSATVAGGDSGANTLGSIINSSNSTISSGASNTVIIGGNNITGGADNTVYVSNLEVTGQANNPVHNNGSGSTFTLDFDNSNIQTVVLTGNTTMNNPSNVKNGASYTVIVKQSAGGPYTINSWGSNFKFESGTFPGLSTGTTSVDIITFISDDLGNLYGIAAYDFQ
jgi:hypothetical protein